jgi:prepilin-type N-terminal cleavage/methylation domain-containing protein
VHARDTHSPARHRRAFSLVELVIVIVILGVIGTIAIPRMTDASRDARTRSFVRTLKTFTEASLVFNGATGGWPAAADPGAAPPELKGWVDTDAWAKFTPLGGKWDSQTNTVGVGFAIGVDFGATPDARTLAGLLRVDEMIDDGSLSTGSARRLTPATYYLVLEASAGAKVVTESELDNAIDLGTSIIRKPILGGG